MTQLKHKPASRWTCNLDFGFAITLFGYQIGFSFDLTEWHLIYDHFEGVGYLLYVGPLGIDILDATKYKEPVDPLIVSLGSQLLEKQKEVFEREKDAAGYYVELEETKKALEQETVRLAGCGVASIGAGDAPDPIQYGYSAAYESVYTLYKKYKQALKLIDQLHVRLEYFRSKEKKAKKPKVAKTRR